tara:strand:+ start:132 stop:236 length:105 start_codon:yes stop_codon:yes gene_type:complete
MAPARGSSGEEAEEEAEEEAAEPALLAAEEPAAG